MDHKKKRIYVAGSNGMVGSAVVRELANNGYCAVITKASNDLDLIDQAAVRTFFSRERPDIVILAAARVGGIMANSTFRAEFLYNNLMIEANVIDAAHDAGVEKLIFLGSSCIYPKNSPQPMQEEYLLTGSLEPTNEPYAVAKIAGLKLCESYHSQYGDNFFTVVPSNLYGSRDNFDAETADVIPALIRKFYEAKTAGVETVRLWGTGNARREFLFVDDLAEAVLYCLEKINADELSKQGISHINIGSGEDTTIRELAGIIAEIVGFEGEISFDPTKPDGMERKLVDTSRMERLGWRYKTSLRDGLQKTYQWYLYSRTD